MSFLLISTISELKKSIEAKNLSNKQLCLNKDICDSLGQDKASLQFFLLWNRTINSTRSRIKKQMVAALSSGGVKGVSVGGKEL